MVTKFALAVASTLMLASASAQDSPASSPNLTFSVGKNGLASLSYDGVCLLAKDRSGDLRTTKVFFGSPSDAESYQPAEPISRLMESDRIRLDYPWGTIDCTYTSHGETLRFRIAITNRCDRRLASPVIQLAELNFPAIPSGRTLDAGMFGFGFKGNMSPLWKYPMVADPTFQVPLVCTDYGTGSLDFCADDLRSIVSVPYTTNHQTKTTYPFVVTSEGAIAPGQKRSFAVSLRFGSAGASVKQLANDSLDAYRKKYPFQVKWRDRRPIGAIFLASSGIKVPTNPRRWILNGGKIDVTTDRGKAAFRDALLKLADNSIKILKETNAQGMITWDPEGQQYLGACYYGDPRLTPKLAPEMECKGESNSATIDKYFKKFRDAGFEVGVCIRPQQITFADGKPTQGAATDARSAGILKSKIAYARRRWGCSLFYIDSTVAKPFRPLDPNVFKEVAIAYPSVLLMPENESMRYFAYSAPLNSYVHHRITSAPQGVRTLYPKAFSALLFGDIKKPDDEAFLVAAMQRGDILIFNCWYSNPGAMKLKTLYEEAVAIHPTHGCGL